ncbi:MAG TPA: ATP-binding cassette domain-containing protein [Anaerolineales bacterium]|nr:ATP-binding cassette domain-containing protein [Anaerolineales bacterium]
MSVSVQNVTRRYGGQAVVNNVSLDVRDGEFFVLLGSSGSGKSTLLKMIAGLVDPDEGTIQLHGQDVTRVPTQERNVGFVFQHYALFQHMTVSENVEFGLQIRRVGRSQRRRRRDELLEMVGLAGLGSRLPRQLSGGQQQRVALARALAIQPDVLLLDEPLGSLDAKIRIDLRRSLRAIQRQSGVATIFVTHDQEEAFDLADRIGVMSYGRLIEMGTPQDLYQKPKTEFVASFLGSANILLGRSEGDQARLGEHVFPLTKDAARLSGDGRVQILFRPEDVALARQEEDLGALPLGEGQVTEVAFSGPVENIRLELPAIPGVRAISPTVPFGVRGFLVDASRGPDQSVHFPIEVGQKVWVGTRRLHTLSHPGLRFLLVTDTTPRSQSALGVGGHLARMAHARVTLLGVGKNEDRLEAHLQEAKREIGSGMASLEVETSSEPPAEAIASAVEKRPVDLVVLGWRPTGVATLPEEILKVGEHHLLLATRPEPKLSRALICVASGEPGKDDVMFAGRLLRHVGAEAALLSVLSSAVENQAEQDQAERFVAGGARSLALFGVPTTTMIRSGNPATVILEEIRDGTYDLVVLGSPLPTRSGKSEFGSVIAPVLKSAPRDCLFLIVRSQAYAARRPRPT